MQKPAFYAILWLCLHCLPLQAQPTGRWVQLSVGTGTLTAYDPLVNEYRYTGAWARHLALSGQLQREQHQFQLVTEAYWGQATPIAYNPLVYEYQRLDVQGYRLHLGYLRRIDISPKVALGLGLGYQAQMQRLQQIYKNLLYAPAVGTRRSYCAALGQVALQVQLHYRITHKHQIYFSGNYSALSLAARPTDNFVNQGATHQRPIWRLYVGRHYQAYALAFDYRYHLTPGLAVGLGLRTHYQRYQAAYAERLSTLQLSLRRQL